MAHEYDCNDCNDTGLLLTERVILHRTQVKDGKLHIPYTTDNDFIKTQCHCVGMEVTE